MVTKASEGTQGVLAGTEPQQTRLAGLPDRIRAFQQASEVSQAGLARRICVGKRHLNLWCQGRVYPPKRLWPALTAAGICSAAELAAWRPRRPARYSLRGMRVYGLAEYAAKA